MKDFLRFAELGRIYDDWKKKPHMYRPAKNGAIRLGWLCSKFNPSLSANELAQQQLEDQQLNEEQRAYWLFIRLILMFEAEEISKCVKRGEEGAPFRSLWITEAQPPPGMSLQEWADFKEASKKMCEPLAHVLGCDVDAL